MNNLQKEKQKMRLERFIEKLNSMSPEQRQKYMAKLAIRMRLNDAKLKDCDECARKLDKAYQKKTIKHVSAYLSLHALGGAAGLAYLGALGAQIAGQPGNEQFGSAVVAGVAGAVLGGAAGFFNGCAYENGPVRKKVVEALEYFNGKKQDKLERQMDRYEDIADGVKTKDQSIAMDQMVMPGYFAQGDYEDMEEYSNY